MEVLFPSILMMHFADKSFSLWNISKVQCYCCRKPAERQQLVLPEKQICGNSGLTPSQCGDGEIICLVSDYFSLHLPVCQHNTRGFMFRLV